MSTIPPITEQNIRQFVDQGSFVLGQQYFREGAISHTRRQDMTLKAQCQGSRPTAYAVQVTFNAIGIVSTSCTCPVGSYCKHVVALLLTWMYQPKKFRKQDAIDTRLEQADKNELVALIKKMLRRHSDLEALVNTLGEQQKPANPEMYRRQVTAIFRLEEKNDEWGTEKYVADDLLTIKEAADNYQRQQDYAGALAVYDAIIKGIIDHYYLYKDEGGALHRVIDECVETLDECLRTIQEDHTLRQRVLELLFAIWRFDIHSGGIGMGENAPEVILQQATADERKLVVGWLRDALSQESSDWQREIFGGFLLSLQADTLDDETFLRLAGETGRTFDVIDRLLTLGRIDEAVKEVANIHDYQLIQVADLFTQHGQDELAERIIRQRFEQSRDQQRNIQLLEWLKQRAFARNDLPTTLYLADEIFRLHPSIESYQEIRHLATSGGHWDDTRQELLTFLNKTQNVYMLIKIALDEDDIDRALDMIKSDLNPGYNYSYGYLYNHGTLAVEVAKAAEAKRPEAAIELYQQHVERLISQKNWGTYHEACEYLKTVRALYEQLGKHEVWKNYISELRKRHNRLRSLKAEMEEAGLFA